MPSSIRRERNVNPFLRCDQQTVKQAAEAQAGRRLQNHTEDFRRHSPVEGRLPGLIEHAGCGNRYTHAVRNCERVGHPARHVEGSNGSDVRAPGQGCMQFLQPPPSSLPVAATSRPSPEERSRSSSTKTVETVELDPAIMQARRSRRSASPAPSRSKKPSRPSTRRPNRARRLVSELGGTGAPRPTRRRPVRAHPHRLRCSTTSITRRSSAKCAGSRSHPEYLDRTFKRGERYLYHIVNEIEARKMPLELALLPVVESAFNPVAYSRARASGLWQFIPGTGRRYGLKQNWYYDGRRDVVAATTAALDYLEFLADEFDGDWLLAVAAYNCGEASVARAVKKNRAAGKPTDFFSLKLPRETRAYVPKLLAMRRIVDDPTAHGLEFAPIANQPYFAQGRRRRADRPARRRRARRAGAGRVARAESCVQSLGHRSGRPAPAAGAGRSPGALRRSCRGAAAREARTRRLSPRAQAATRSAASPTSTACRSRRSRPRTRFAAR